MYFAAPHPAHTAPTWIHKPPPALADVGQRNMQLRDIVRVSHALVNSGDQGLMPRMDTGPLLPDFVWKTD
jgi:hypothetical protein